MENFDYGIVLSTIFGALVGGVVSIATTSYFRWKEKIERQQTLANSLTLKLLFASEEIYHTKHHLQECLPEGCVESVPIHQLWGKVMPMVGEKKAAIEISSEELGILTKPADNDLVNRLIEVFRAHNIIVELNERYEALRNKIENDPNLQAKVSEDGQSRSFEVDGEKDSTSLRSNMIKAGSLLQQLKPMSDEMFDHALCTQKKLTASLPKYFPKKTKLKQASFSVPAHPPKK